MFSYNEARDLLCHVLEHVYTYTCIGSCMLIIAELSFGKIRIEYENSSLDRKKIKFIKI